MGMVTHEGLNATFRKRWLNNGKNEDGVKIPIIPCQPHYHL